MPHRGLSPVEETYGTTFDTGSTTDAFELSNIIIYSRSDTLDAWENYAEKCHMILTLSGIGCDLK
jgi:hypothetical protein